MVSLDQLVEQELAAGREFVLLEQHNEQGCVVSRFYREPLRILQADNAAGVRALLLQLDQVVSSGLHAAGFLTYEAGCLLQGLDVPLPADGFPLAWFGVFGTEEEYCHGEGDAQEGGGEVPVQDIRFGLGYEEYLEKMARIRELLAAGEVYQINFTFPVRCRIQGSLLDCYRALCRRQPVAHAALLRQGSNTLISLSPELFFQRRGDLVFVRPMKGTAARSGDRAQERAARSALRKCEKNRAENLMIVDLLRNDLGRIAQPGSVRVPDLFRIETYPTLFQMTSTIEARLRPGLGYSDIFQSLFPCGSVTGAPKQRAMEHISGLEQQPRGVYCGTIGYLAPDNEASFSVAIRTLTCRGKEATLGIGSGIVWDSRADDEYLECLHKARFLLEGGTGFHLIETLRFQRGRWRSWNLHRERLLAAARRFAVPLDPVQLDLAVADLGDRLGTEEWFRVRITVDRSGAISLSHSQWVAQRGPVRVGLAGEPTHSHDPFLYHKTSIRERYQRWHTQAREQGWFDCLFINQRGELSEGCISNLFVKLDGRLLTPALECGLLPGVLRKRLLQRGTAEEAVLFPHDLQRAESVYVGNSLRGLRTAVVDQASLEKYLLPRGATRSLRTKTC